MIVVTTYYFLIKFLQDISVKELEEEIIVHFTLTVIAIPTFYGLYHVGSIFERIVYTIVLIVATTGFSPILGFYMKFST